MVDLTKINPIPESSKSSGFFFIISAFLIIWGLAIYKKYVDDKEEDVLNKPISEPINSEIEEVITEEIEDEEK